MTMGDEGLRPIKCPWSACRLRVATGAHDESLCVKNKQGYPENTQKRNTASWQQRTGRPPGKRQSGKGLATPSNSNKVTGEDPIRSDIKGFGPGTWAFGDRVG